MDDERLTVDMDTTRLTIRNTQLTDDGNFACSVKTTGFPPIVSNSAHLYVYSQCSYCACLSAEFLPVMISAIYVEKMCIRCRL